MLDGQYGAAVSQAMQMLTELGEAYGAENMLDIKGAHVFAWKVAGDLPGNVVLQKLVDMAGGERVKVPCTSNPLTLNLDLAERLGLPDDLTATHRENISRLQTLVRDSGVIPTYSCNYHYPFEPKLGDHYALTESNVCIFVNSWYGMMSNMEGDMTALASAITGKTPRYGLYLDENRHGRVLVRLSDDVDAAKLTNADFGAISYRTGEIIGDDRVPVYVGFPEDFTATRAKYMQPQVAHSSSALFHVVGATPEAPTLEAALGGRKPEEAFTISRTDIEDVYRTFNTTDKREIDIVGIGCPHCTLEELGELAGLLQGKRVSDGTRLFIGTSAAVKSLADRMGLVKPIEEAGGWCFPTCARWACCSWVLSRYGT